ncbi:MAG: DUF47 family protein [Coriobacteriales bacterium]|jgi:predicted phosphate transport protein (TIGR00153 family)|nr:DUF47 family protein [Coriobacteriales bacterium]
MPKKKFDYFEAMVVQGNFAVQESELLLTYMKSFDPEKVSEWIVDMHEIENAADSQIHDIFKNLANEFVTPIDREDLIHLSQRLDDIVDYVEDVLQLLYFYDVQKIFEMALPLAEVVVSAAQSLKTALEEFHNFRKSKELKGHIVRVNDLEEEADHLYAEGMKHLYRNYTDNPLFVMIWSNLFDRLERCADACENVADIMDTVVLKNT